MPNFIDEKRNAIANDRLKAFWYKLAGYATRAVGLAVLLTGMIEGLALAEFRDEPFSKIPEFGAWVWNLMNDHVPLLWSFLLWISPPYPGLTLRPPTLLPWLSWAGYIWGLAWLGDKLSKISKSLSKRASRTEEMLDFHEPLLLQMQSMPSGALVNVVNTINNTRKNDKKSWWELPMGIFGIGVAINIFCKILQVN